MVRHLLTLTDLSKTELLHILDVSEELKKETKPVLKNKTLGMWFEKPSLRTRVSFEVAITQLGGHGIFLNKQGVLHKKEDLEDTSKVLSRYVDVIMARVYSHKTLIELSKHSGVPVINGLCNLYHPCQTLADLMTIREKRRILEGLKLVYVGDGSCNTAHSTMIGCAMTGIECVIVTPEQYLPNREVLKKAQELGNVTVSHDLYDAVKNADVLYTDVWVSMGMEDETKERIKNFAMRNPPIQINMNVIKKAKPDVIVMHCLPAMKGYEITSEAIQSHHSVVYDQAENRLHTEKAIILFLLNQNI